MGLGSPHAHPRLPAPLCLSDSRTQGDALPAAPLAPSSWASPFPWPSDPWANLLQGQQEGNRGAQPTPPPSPGGRWGEGPTRLAAIDFQLLGTLQKNRFPAPWELLTALRSPARTFPAPPVLLQTVQSRKPPHLGPVVTGQVLRAGCVLTSSAGVSGVHNPFRRQGARASRRPAWNRCPAPLCRDLGMQLQACRGHIADPDTARGMGDPAGGPGAGSEQGKD